MEVVIKPKGTLFNFRELWHYRELLYVFTWRDLKVRYKQTLLGMTWVLFQPMVTTAIFSIFFGKLAKLPSDNLPYPLFVYIGLAIWTFFSNALNNASMSLISYEAMIKKVYFPRIIIPLSTILTALVDFGVTMFFLCLLIIYFGVVPNWINFIFLPLILIILLMTTSGLSLFTSAFNVKYRDVRYILPFFIQIGLFVSPVIYPTSVLFDYRKWLLYINPLTGVIESSRSIIAGTTINLPLLGIATIVSLLLFLIGLLYFSRTEKYFADIA